MFVQKKKKKEETMQGFKSLLSKVCEEKFQLEGYATRRSDLQ